MDELCSACLSGGRKLCSLNETNYFQIYTQILEEISVCAWSGGVRVCWECASVLRRWTRFKRDAQRAALHLMRLELLPGAPAPAPLSRLSIDPLRTDMLGDSVSAVKCEPDGVWDEMPLTFAHELSPHRDVGRDVSDDSATHAADDVNDHHKQDISYDVKPDDIALEEKATTQKRKTKKLKHKTKKHKSLKKKLKDLITFESEDENKKSTNVNITVSDGTASGVNDSNITLSETAERDECGATAKKPRKLRKHLNPHTNSTQKQKTESSDKPRCEICDKQFSSNKTYKYHMNTLHSGGGDHLCGECGRRYQWKSNLARHTRTHRAVAAGELHCAVCDRSFASVATYRTHLACSSKHVAHHDKPFACGECGARFVNKTRLRDHVDWEHLHTVKFRCALCDKPFKSHTSLYIHQNNVHHNKGRKDHLCHICGKAYQNVCKLRAHVGAAHGAAPAHRCSCGAAFTWHSSYYRHHRHCASKTPSKKGNKKEIESDTDAIVESTPAF